MGSGCGGGAHSRQAVGDEAKHDSEDSSPGTGCGVEGYKVRGPEDRCIGRVGRVRRKKLPKTARGVVCSVTQLCRSGLLPRPLYPACSK